MARSKDLAFVLILAFTLWTAMIPRIHAFDDNPAWTAPVVIPRTRPITAVSLAEVDRGLAVDPQGNIHIAYSGYDGNDHEIFYANNVNDSYVNGSWVPYWAPYDVTETNSRHESEPTIAIDQGGTVHILYSSYDAPGYGIYHIMRIPAGWSPSIKISESSEYQSDVSAAVDSQGCVHAVWWGYDGSSRNDAEIFYSNNIGGSWSQPLNVTENDWGDFKASIAIDSQDAVHIVWQRESYDQYDGYNLDIYYASNADGSWEITRILDTGHDYGNPLIGVDKAGNVHVACASPGYYIGVRYISRMWNSWGTSVPIDDIFGTGGPLRGELGGLSLTVDEDNDVHVVFSMNATDYDGFPSTGNTEIFYTKYSRQGVVRWSEPISIVQDGAEKIMPNIVIDDKYGCAHIVYINEGDGRIYYVKSTGAVGASVFDAWGSGTSFNLDATDTLNVTLEVNSTQPILVEIMRTIMPGNTPAQSGLLGSAFSITANSSSGFNITITYYYADSEVLALGLNESSLTLNYWNDTVSTWSGLSTILNTADNVLTATVDHLTIFGTFGQTQPFAWLLVISGAGIIAAIGISLFIRAKYSKARAPPAESVIESEVGPFHEADTIPEEHVPIPGIICPNCGHENPYDSSFCARCGLHLGEIATG